MVELMVKRGTLLGGGTDRNKNGTMGLTEEAREPPPSGGGGCLICTAEGQLALHTSLGNGGAHNKIYQNERKLGTQS